MASMCFSKLRCVLTPVVVLAGSLAPAFLSLFLSPLALAADERVGITETQRAELASRNVVSQPSVSAAQAAASVRQQHGGRVLSVNAIHRGDTVGYNVRVLVEGGRVKTVYVRSGSANSEGAARPRVPQAESELRRQRSEQRPATRPAQRSGSRSGVRTISDG